ncbi:MAG: insulinase family protein, partial [Deltaproteobacteria bacterium]|nr:insulinase family protein [Deltaproteobacteria bacterium]
MPQSLVRRAPRRRSSDRPSTVEGRALPLRVARRTLGNGLRVVAVEQPHLHRVAIELLCRVGSRYETSQTNGLSHFLEHMLFRGTRRFPSHFALADAIERLGATLMATTYPDYTTFEVSVPPSALDDALAIFADVIASPSFLDLEVEKGIVREEILEDLDENGRDVDADNLVRRLLFGAHPLGLRVTGGSRNITRFEVPDLEAHRRRHYVGRNLALSVAGAVTAEQVFAAAERRLARLDAGRRITARAPTSIAPGPRCEVHDSQGNQSDVRISFRTFSERDPRMP